MNWEIEELGNWEIGAFYYERGLNINLTIAFGSVLLRILLNRFFFLTEFFADAFNEVILVDVGVFPRQGF